MTSVAPGNSGPVVVVGGANMDISAKADSLMTPGDSTPGTIQYAPGGVGRNIAENLARLGVGAKLVSVVGDDAFGDQILARTADAGVDISAVQKISGGRTATYLAMLQPFGEVAMAVNDMAILERLAPDTCSLDLVPSDEGRWLLLDCNLPQATLIHLLNLNFKVVVDGVSVAKCQRVASSLDRVHVLKLNHMEAAALSGMPVDTEMQCVAAAQHFLNAGVTHVVISFGAAGLAWGQRGDVPVFRHSRPVSVVSSTGAGDALLSGIVASLVRGALMKDAVDYGVACAELTLSSTFANFPDLTHGRVQQQMGQTV